MATGLGSCSRPIEAAERMHAYHCAGAFASQVEIADVKLISRPFKFRFVARVNRAGQTKLGIVSNAQSVVVIVSFDHCEHGTEDFFLLDCRAGFHVRNYSWFDEKPLLAIRTTAGNDTAAF